MLIIQGVVMVEEGIHSRIACELVDIVKNSKSEVFLIKGKERLSCQSIINILTSNLSKNTLVKFEIDGKDEDDVAKKFERIIFDSE